MGGGKKKPKKADPVYIPEAPAPPPPPEETAMAPVTADEYSSRKATRDSKKKGTSALRIELSTPGSATGSSGGLNLPSV